MPQVLYRKWRPCTWDEVVGQEHVITTLRNAVSADRISHAFLFSGPRGTGKTSTARLLAKAANCLAEDLVTRPCNQCEHCLSINRGEFLDLIEIDAASNTSVDDVRDLRDKINFLPNWGRYKVYIIDEVHMLSTAAFNALLKTLEEPPSHAIFILATTEAHKIPATVSSRCQRHEFRRIPLSLIIKQLHEVSEQEGLEVEGDVFKLVARQATGSLRDAISLLDQLASVEEKITFELARNVLGTAASQSVLDILDAIVEQDAALGLKVLQEALDGGSDPRQFARQIVGYLRNLLFLQMGNIEQLDTTQETQAKTEHHAQALSPKNLLSIIRIFNDAANKSQSFWQPSLPLELAFISALGKVGSIDEHRYSRGEKKSPRESTKLKAQSFPRKEESQALDPPEENTSSSSGVEKNHQGDKGNIFQEWSQILALVQEKNPTTQSLLSSGKPVGIKEGKLILSFDKEFRKSKMMQGDHLTITQQVIERVMGYTLPIQCVIGTHHNDKMPPNVKPGGMVSTAVRDLGGKYVSDND